MAKFIITVLADDGSVTMRHVTPLFQESELSARYHSDSGHLIIREASTKVPLIDADLVTLLLAGGETVSWVAIATQLEALARRLRDQVA